MKGFASEFLDIVAVVGLFVNSVVRPHGILAKEIECFDNMARILDIYRRRDFADLARLEIATERHHVLFMELYPNCAIPKLHLIRHIGECWREHGTLLSCFGAEANHRATARAHRYSFNKSFKMALA